MRLLPLALGLLLAASIVLAEETRGDTTVYLTPEEALRLVLPDCDSVTAKTYALADGDRKALEEKLGRKILEESFTVHTGSRKGAVYGRAVIASEVGKFKPFDFVVCVSPEGKTLDVAVLVYRESRGGEIARKRFHRQLVGKSLDDPIRIHRDIVNVTGATMSVRAICAGVRKVLAVVDHFAGATPPGEKRELPRAPDRIVFTPPGGPVTRSRPAMGTLLTMTAAGLGRDSAEAAIDRAFDAVENLDRAMSLYRPDSELVLATARAASGPVRLGPDLFRAIALAREAAERSDGAFDPTVGPLVRLWGFIGEGTRVPSDAAIAAARARVGWRRVGLDPAAFTLRLDGAGVEIDLGGIAKGYAVDRAVEILQGAGATSGAVDFSGNLRAFGPEPRIVAVQHPRDPAGALAVLALRDFAVSTSGDYEKFFVQDGVRFGHILDPRTGRPAQGTASVTAIAPTAAEADALSTALFVAGVERGRDLLERFDPEDGALVVTVDARGEIAGVERAGRFRERER